MSTHTDPRPARSRARLLEAATALLRTGGPSAVTVDAVIRASKVARATLYRHFPSGNDLLAAAFHALIPPAPLPPEGGTLRDRLIAALDGFADLIAEAPISLAATSWLALGGGLDPSWWGKGERDPESDAVRTLRERVAEQYAEPFDAIFDSPDGRAAFGAVDRMQAVALLAGPILLGKLSTLTDFDYRTVARMAVDGFLATHQTSGETTAAST
ncbi:helix-turn-helix domain-containing protein [Mycobacterium sp. ITM-2016-00316]|uniref:TetR/AcrR family transcriptional regulator n=1 Tax=Mycobacterium sp. ITM-2016-00316 TaxID=2099695 RepID=UPI000CF9152F|nr:TetR/AcrR family transcriptional regulator [Mycobacterium sp. ITM-2016-00316]WNG82996.1 helix-turn-helix domain-containing protein [Mycobacterium sp. ITM-2016-00316]